MFGFNEDLEKFSLKYPDKVPKDYDVSQMKYTFDFIYLVLKRDSDIDKAIEGVAKEYGLSEGYLMDYLIENKYLLNKTNHEQFSKQIKSYNTKALKKILKSHGMKTSGKREKIEKRILDNNLLGNNCYLSSKSKVFYKNKKRRMRIYNRYLENHYYFDEFNEYYMDNFRKKVDKIPVEFINQYIDKAFDDKDHRMYTLNNQVLVEYYCNKENYKKMLHHVLINFCINLNPTWKIDELKDHGGFPLQTYDNLIFLNEQLGKNVIIPTYYVVWDSFNFDRVIVSKYAGYKYLKDILNLKDYDRIVDEMQANFYLNDDLKIKKITQKTLFDF